jgi:uncharacterized protein (DUF1501 family)
MSHGCCNDFTRAQLLRGAAAEAGRGLPAIEPGMPEPAGTGLTRRKFISRSAGLALAVYGASKIPISAFDRGIAEAAQGDKVLISVFFEGGIDALSVLAPIGDPKYASLRPNLKQAEGDGPTFTEDTRLQWHPGAAPLATLHEEGKVAAFPAIGYEHPDQSHFTSRHYYEIGELDIGQHAGWLGRYLDVVGDEENRWRRSAASTATKCGRPSAVRSTPRCTNRSPPSGRCPPTPRGCCRSAVPPARPRRCARN